jgi:hypothetical protein
VPGFFSLKVSASRGDRVKRSDVFRAKGQVAATVRRHSPTGRLPKDRSRRIDIDFIQQALDYTISESAHFFGKVFAEVGEVVREKGLRIAGV